MTKVLDTTVGETGPAQLALSTFLKNNVPMRFSIELGAGDTIVVEGKSNSAESYKTLHSFTTSSVADIYVSQYWRARRTVDGGSDSQLYVENHFSQNISTHE